MLKWFRAMMPKEDRFFDLLEQHSKLVVAGAEALRAALDGGPTSTVISRQSWSGRMTRMRSPARSFWRCGDPSSPV